MRLAIVLAAAAFLAAPAVAQRVIPAPVTPPADKPPPEGFYKGIPNAYDLLNRLYASNDITLVSGRKLSLGCDDLRTGRTDREAAADYRNCLAEEQRLRESVGAPVQRQKQ